jgi:PTS system nitrogen regulatory IIA component
MTPKDEAQSIMFELFMDDPLYTVQEAADYCKVSKSTIRKWKREGRIPSVYVCSDIRFRRSDLNKFINENLSWGWVKGNTK